MNVLITGGCGFVGRHFSKRFCDLCYNVTCIDNLTSSGSLHPNIWPNHLKCKIVFINDDCKNYFKSKNESFDLILHLAAVVGGRVLMENDPICIAENLTIDVELFKYAIKQPPKKLIYFSSSAVYPIKYQNDGILKLSENMLNFNDFIGIPDLTYGWSKLSGEYLSKIMHEKYGLNIACYRPFSGYGEDQDISYPFPAILTKIMNADKTIQIWSNSVRDFIYIEDVIDCVLKTMNNIDNADALNIGTGIGTSFEELTSKMCELLNHDAVIEVVNDKPKGVHYRVSDSNKMNSFGFTPTTSIENGIVMCSNFLKINKNHAILE